MKNFQGLTWVPLDNHRVPLSKRHENARLILFSKIINNLVMVPHSCLEKVDGRTRKIQHEVSAHRLQRGSLWTIALS